MWFITHTTSGESVCLLPEKLKYSVGRLGADVELQDDICVSRAHAAFHLVKDGEEYKLELEDLGSKYGTFLNKDIETNTAVAKCHKIALKNNDLIRFGRLQNIWKVQTMNIKTATSSLTKEDTVQLQKYITALHGKILDEWSPDCTHLTMTDKCITMKLLHALVEQRQVVTPNYWKDLLNAANNVKTQLPKMESYKPDFNDDDINLNCNIKRLSLFKGYTFVFLNRKHFETYSPIVRSAGGSCKDLNSGVQKAFLIKDKVVVVEYTPSTQTQSSQTISTIAEFLESNSKRIIPEYEIGFAILHCSMKMYCNACYKMPNTTPALFPSEMSNDSIRIDLTEEQSTPSLNTESMDLVISETNENMVTSTPFANTGNFNPSLNKEEQTTVNIPVENQRKRKVMSVDLNESDEEDLFKFQSKKTCNKQDNNDGKEKVVDTAEAKSAATEPIKENRHNTTNVFLQKTQNKTQVSLNQTEEQPSTSRENRKRPLIQVLNEDDEGNDDDLFSFGDTQKKKPRKETNEEDDDLFSFKEKEGTTTKKPIRTIEVDEDSNDMQPTQEFIVTKKPPVQMPIPKILPRKISAIEWISSSLGKINIKKEKSDLINNENEDENIIKTETEIKTELDDEIAISGDHRKWLESLKDAIEVQQVSLTNTIKSSEKSHYKFKNRSNNTTVNLNETVPNFKRFVKKYHVPAQNNSTVIKLHLR